MIADGAQTGGTECAGDNGFGWPKVVLVLDTEGNGQQPPDLIELAAVPLLNGVLTPAQARSVLVRPPRPVTQRATALHGLSNQTLSSAQPWTQLSGQIRADLDGVWICAHHAHTDYEILLRHLPGWSPAGVLDTLRLARHLHPALPRHTLDALVAHLGIDLTHLPGQWHRAGFDALADALLLLALAQHTSGWNNLTHLAVPPGLPGRRQPHDAAAEEPTLW